MLYTVAIAVCLAATPLTECHEPTAVAWIVSTEQPNSPAGCLIHGMQYAANSRLVSDGSYAKVFCTPDSGPRLKAALPR